MNEDADDLLRELEEDRAEIVRDVPTPSRQKVENGRPKQFVGDKAVQ